MRLLQRFDIIPEKLHLREELFVNGASNVIQPTSSHQQQSTVADEDLFTRAAELNSTPQALILSTSEAEFEVQSR